MARIRIPFTDREFLILGTDKVNKIHKSTDRILANKYSILAMLNMMKVKEMIDAKYMGKIKTLLEEDEKYIDNISDTLR